MATILGLDIDPHTVRGVVLRTALRKSEVVAYVSVPIPSADEVAAQLGGPTAAAHGPSAPAPQDSATPDGGWVSQAGDDAPAEGEPPGPDAAAHPETGAAGHPAPTEEPATPPAEGAAAEPPDDNQRLRVALRSLLARIGGPPDKIITELSGDEVSIRKVTLPSKAAKKLDQLLPFELEGKIPFEATESVVDHQPIETVGGELRMLASVAPKDKIRAHLTHMKDLGLEPREVAVGAVALDGLVPLLPETLSTPGPHCLIDVHPEGTDVCILQNGVCHFARTLSVTSDDISVRNDTKRLERELKQTLAAWRMEGGMSPSTVYVCGQLAVYPETPEFLAHLIQMPVEVLPLPPPVGAPAVEDPERPAFARAAALAGRALHRGKLLNARQGEFAAAQTVTALRQHLPLIATCAAVVIGAFVFSSYARYSVLEARHQQLEDELARVTDDYFRNETRDPSQATRMLERGGRGNDPMPAFDAYDAMEAISAAIPEAIEHDVRQLQIDLGDGEETGRFSLRGVVSSVAETDQILNAIRTYRVVQGQGDAEERMVCFHEVELVGNVGETGDERRSYRLEGDIHCEPEDEAGDDDEEEEDE